ncbi:MAG: hypothetical protein WB819_09425 [Terriglobia bacterium]
MGQRPRTAFPRGQRYFVEPPSIAMEQVSNSSNQHEKFSRHVLCLAVGLLVAGLAVVPSLSAQQADTPATLTYIKVMKGSVPEYTSLTVDANGDGSYDGRRLDESPKPRSLKLSPGTTAALFQAASVLGDFHSIRLESHKSVANMGLKTFIYRHNGQENKVEFNYTRNKRAEELLSIFEGIADVEQHIGTLEYSSRYDVLGLPSALTRVEIDLDNKALVDPQLMVPILKKIAGDSQYLHIAQIRAADILRRIQGSKYSGKADRR